MRFNELILHTHRALNHCLHNIINAIDFITTKAKQRKTEQNNKRLELNIKIEILMRSGPLSHQGKTTMGQKPKLIQPATTNNRYTQSYVTIMASL